MTPRDEVEATVWRVLRNRVARVLSPGIDHQDEAIVNALVDPHLRDLEADVDVLMQCFGRGVDLRMSALRGALRNRTGLDNDLVDEALVVAAEWEPEDSQ